MVLRLAYRLSGLEYAQQQALKYVLLLGLLQKVVSESPFGHHRNRHCRLHIQVGEDESHDHRSILVQRLGYQDGEVSVRG